MLTCLLAEKETAFSSGVYPTVAALRRRGATAYVADPMYTADELDAIGLPGHRDEPVTAAVIQADHVEYRTLTEADLPGVRVLVDGRRVTDPKAFTTIRRALMCEEGCAGVASRACARSAASYTSPRSETPTTSTSTSLGGGPELPWYRAAQDP